MWSWVPAGWGRPCRGGRAGSRRRRRRRRCQKCWGGESGRGREKGTSRAGRGWRRFCIITAKQGPREREREGKKAPCITEATGGACQGGATRAPTIPAALSGPGSPARAGQVTESQAGFGRSHPVTEGRTQAGNTGHGNQLAFSHGWAGRQHLASSLRPRPQASRDGTLARTSRLA